MLIVKVELWPFGNEDEKEEIASAKIWNTGTGTLKSGNYNSIFNSNLHGQFSSQLNNHNRNKNVWNLISNLIQKGIPE